MTLIFDERAQLTGQPGLHALISGVSLYKHLPDGGPVIAANTYGMEQLDSPALSAYSIYKWLLNQHANSQLSPPLATIRLLLSPSDKEIARDGSIQNLADNSTRDNFSKALYAWLDDARQNSSNTTFFYFAGHGVQRNRADTVLLFEDFGAPGYAPLHFAGTVDNIFYGMAPPADPTKTVAQNQLFFIDACRIQPDRFKVHEWMNVPDFWAIESNGVDNRSAPIFYATVPGDEAQGRPADISFFCEALLACLDRSAAEYKRDAAGNLRWQVSSVTLIRALKSELDLVNTKHGTTQECLPSGYLKDVLINYLNTAPVVDLDIEIDPTGAPFFRLTVTDANTNASVFSHPAPFLSPQRTTIPAGLYKFAAEIASPPQPPFRDHVQIYPVMPPRESWRAVVR